MGNVASRLDDAGNLFFKDQNRCMWGIASESMSIIDILIDFSVVSIASVTISSPRRRLLTLTPNAFPAVRFAAKRDAGDDTPIEYIQVRTIS
jgi:Arf-GAP/SH3 domain/ANK repeat/PH domain-containing protein